MVCLTLTFTLALAPSEFARAATPRRHPRVPGRIIDHSPASSRIYLGSPGLAITPAGEYFAKCDEFGPGSTERRQGVTRIYRSDNRGRTWTRLADVKGIYWATLFAHRGALYLIGTDRLNGRLVIRRSTDGAKTWTVPADAETGLLRPERAYHCAPVPVVIHNGRIWRAMENTKGPGGWGSHFRAFMMSADADADLLQSDSWTFSNAVGGDPHWLDGGFGGWLEGNAVVTPQGGIVDFLRVDLPRPPEKAALIHISPDGTTATFNPGTDFIDFPGGAKKFTIRYDPRSRRYWSLVNPIPQRHRRAGKPGAIRNTLALSSSTDLHHWQVRSVLLYNPEVAHHGFQYVDWLFDGNDIVAVVRTSYEDGLGGAHSYHDANYLNFLRVRNFRTRVIEDSPSAIVGDFLPKGRPRVLILGDSISMGYTPYLRRMIGGQAVVLRPMRLNGAAENCAGTTRGIRDIDRWLKIAGGHWTVIQFNFGLHDLKRVHPDTGANSNNPDDPRQAEPKQYAKQLRQIVARLKTTGARLIFANTTPVPPGPLHPYRDVGDPARYNRIAANIMRENEIPITDLYAAVEPHLATVQLPANVHFRAAGYRLLAEQCVPAIRRALAEPNSSPLP